MGHIGGLVVPESWTEAVGISEGLYHFNALLFGGLAGFCLVGIAILVYRRRTTGPVFMATTRNDKTMCRPRRGNRSGAVDDAEQRWRRSRGARLPRDGRAVVPVAVRSPAGRGRDGRSPFSFQLHTLVGLVLFAIWPFTRLVHAFTAPVHYLFRPYVVYRTRDSRTNSALRADRRGWQPVGTRDREGP